MREAYDDTLTSTEEIRAWANAQTMHEGLPEFFPKYYKRRAEAGVSIRSFMTDNPETLELCTPENNAKQARTCRFIDHKKYNFSPELNIYDNKVLYTSWREKMAELHKMMHDLLWEKLKKTTE